MKTKAAAVLTIRNAADMTPEGRADIVRWLDRQKRFFLKHYKELSPTFRARYVYE
jgi:hypothetical protein